MIRPAPFSRLMLSLAACLLGAEMARASAVCTLRLLGKNYDLHYVQPSQGVYPRFNALSERVEYDLDEFGTLLASTAAGVLGGSTAGTFGIHLGQSPLDPDRAAGSVRSEAEDISPDGRYVIGWRQERPGFGDRPPRAFLYSNDDGFQFLDEIYPAVRELATRPFPAPDGRVHGSKGLAINDAGLMIIESVPDPAGGSPAGHYFLSRDGSVTGFEPRGGIDLNASGQMPGPGMAVINDRGQQAVATDINNLGFLGDPSGYVVTPAGQRINLVEAILSQCDNEIIRRELEGPAGTRPVFINDAGEILFGHLFLSPSCPLVTFTAAGQAGFEFIDGKISVRLGNRISIQTTVRNTGRGVLENIRIEPPDGPRLFERVGMPSPPIPSQLLPGESVVSVAEWEATALGEFFGVTTLRADGPCGPIVEQVSSSRIFVIERPPAIEITAPTPDEIVPRGRPYAIRFDAPEDVEAVDLYLVRTRNPNGPRSLLAEGVPASTGRFLWEVPEDLESPSTFVVAVDADDPAREGVSRRFRVRQPWRLHRIIGTFNEPRYERISVANHIWGFDQSDENMWPAAYWNRPYHNYWDTEGGYDPFIGENVRYDPEFFTERSQWEWPPWPALVRAFGIPAAYLSPEPWTYGGILMHQPNRDAADRWEFKVLSDPTYQGVCYGLSLSLLAAFQDPERFDSRWLPGGGSRELARFIPSSPGVRDAAHALQLYTWGRLDLSERLLNSSRMTPRDVVERLKEMFERDDRSRDRFLIIEGLVDSLDANGDQETAAHAMVPFGMTNLDETTYQIAVYDPNHGSEGVLALLVDVAENSWWHSDDYWEGGVGEGLYLSTEAIRAFEPASSPWPHDFEPGRAAARVTQTAEPPATLSVQIVGQAAAVTSASGELRYERGRLTKTLTGGFMAFPVTGRPSQPDQFVVPAVGAYRAEAVTRSNGLAAIRLEGGAVSVRLQQTEAAPGSRVHVDLLDQGLAVTRGGAGRIELAARMPKEFGEFHSIRVAGLATPDPAGLRLTAEGDGFRLVGPAAASTYHLELDLAGPWGRRIFHRTHIPLAAGAIHAIQPDWNTLDKTPVSIGVDYDGDGRTDESLLVENQAPSSVLWPDRTDPALRLEVRLSPAGTPEVRVVSPMAGRIPLEWSLEVLRWTDAGSVEAGQWLAITDLPGITPRPAGPVFLRIATPPPP